MAAAAITVLMKGSASSTGEHSIAASVFSSVLGTGRKQWEECDSPWYNACGENLTCYDPGYSRTRYCVPMGEQYACCEYAGDSEVSGIDCAAGLLCDDRTNGLYDTVSTCHPSNQDWELPTNFAKKRSCNVDTGKPANILIHCVETCLHFDGCKTVC